MTARMWVPVDIQHVSRGEWRAYIPGYDQYVHETSKPKLEYETFRVLEEAFGLRAFSIIWREV